MDAASASPPGEGPERSAVDLVPDVGEDVETSAQRPTSLTKKLVRVGLVLAFLVVAWIVLRDKVPTFSAISAALRNANWWWVVAALALQIASLGLQIRQQQRLLSAFGVEVSMPRMGAITYSSTAISMSMPVGGAVSAGYTYRQYRASGATAATAATVLLLSGLGSFLALIALTVAGVGVTWLRDLIRFHHQPWWPLVALVVALGAVVEILVLLLGWWGRRRPRKVNINGRLAVLEEKHPRLGPIIRQVTLTGRQASHLPGRDWRFVLLVSAGNWGLDAACLYASCEAFGIRIGVLKLGAIYIGVQLIRQIPITPGGIGVIEAALLAGLIAARAAKGPAAAAVLVYRLFAAWLIVPIGFVMLAMLRRMRKVPAPPASSDA